MQPRHTDVLERENSGQNQNSRAEPARAPAKGQTREKGREKTVDLILKQPNARSVCVAGSFNNWDQSKTPLQKVGDGASWRVTLPLRPGRYEYRFVADGQWISDPNAKETSPNDFGSTNAVLVV